MSDTNHCRLPSIDEFYPSWDSSVEHAHERVPLVEPAAVRSTPLTPPLPRPVELSTGANNEANRPSWRAINRPHQQEHSSPHRAEPREAGTMHDRPITLRQDSANSEIRPANKRTATAPARPAAAAAAATTTSSTNKPAGAVRSSSLEREQRSNHLSLRDAISYQSTPPSPAPSPEAQPTSIQSAVSTAHDRQKSSSSAVSRRYANIKPNPQSDQSTKAPTTPRRAKKKHPSTNSVMPPPPSPSSIVSVQSSVPSQVLPSSPSVNLMSDPSRQRFAASTGPSSLDRTTAISHPRPESDSSSHSPISGLTRCFYCNDVWKFTYPELNPNSYPVNPSTSIRESGNFVDSLVRSIQEHRFREDELYREWKQHHLVEPEDAGTTKPCPAAQRPQLSAFSISNKRKADVVDDGQMVSKLRRLSCDSPPHCQRTPPPDTPSTSTTHKSKPMYDYKDAA
jgi:hypothetical protein